jgi:Family of unknown function (DUF5678)
MLNEKAPQNGDGDSPDPFGPQSQNDDLFWAQHDPSVEEHYAGEWVVPIQRRIVSHGKDLDAVLEEAARVTCRRKEELVACAIPHPDDWLADA